MYTTTSMYLTLMYLEYRKGHGQGSNGVTGGVLRVAIQIAHSLTQRIRQLGGTPTRKPHRIQSCSAESSCRRIKKCHHSLSQVSQS